MLQDLRFALRMIGTHRWFSAAVIVTLALGIGINTTVFTLVNAVLFKPVPLPGGERLVVVSQFNPKDPRGHGPVSWPDFQVFRSENHGFAGLEALERRGAVISENGNPAERFNMGVVSAGLFDMIRTPPILGRGFTAADGRAGAPTVVLLGHNAWQRRYAGASDVIGRAVRLNGAPATIIGVMPAGFMFPDTQDLWTVLTPTPEREDRTKRTLMLFGMLQPGTSRSTAQGDLVLLSTRLAKDYPATNKELSAQVQTFHEAFNGGPIKLIFLLMLGAVGFVLLIACANVANMMLSRAVARSREIAVRAAMGASRWQLVRQLLTESVLLSSLGGLLGLGLAAAGVHAFDLATQDVGKPFWILFEMDWRAFAYFAAISVLSGIVFGLVPALRASRVDLNTALKDGTAGGTHRGGRLTGALVVLQFALTVILLAGAGLMVRSFFAVQKLNAFVPAEHLLTARVRLPEGKGDHYESVESRRLIHDKLANRLANLPGVTSVVLASDFPGLGADNRDLEIEGRPAADPEHRPRGAAIFATPNYLATAGLPLLNGRALAENDGETGRESAVVTRAFAARYWPDQSPIGRRFRFYRDGKPEVWNTVVGVCGDIVQDAMDRDAPPVVYLSNRQEPWGWLGLMLRTDGDPTALPPALRSAVQEIDADLPLFEVRTLPAAIEKQHWFIKVFGTLFFAFAVIALLMASVGIYAVVAQNTARRTREIGIRMALGATADRVVRLVLARGLVQLGLGLALGLGGALAATRLMNTILAVSPTDPLVFATVPVLLGAIGLFACWLPARRAARVAPTVALRTE